MSPLNLPTLGELCSLVAGRLRGGSTETIIAGVSSIESAVPDQITWLSDAKLARTVARSRAGAIIVSEAAGPMPMPALIVADPDEAIARVLERFRVPIERPDAGVHPTAMIADGAEIAAGAAIGAYVWIGRGARVGERSVVHPGAHLGSGCTIGRDCEICPNVYIGDGCRLGDRVVVKPGAVIGSDGFGFIFRDGQHRRVPQIGIVILEDDVEIGGNSCVDRAKFGATVIGRGTKIDNLVQIGHNCTLGPCCILTGQVGLSGSVRLGMGVVMGGQSGVGDGVRICDGARIGGAAAVFKDIVAPGDWFGAPARPHVEFNRALAAARRVPELIATVRELSKRVADLEAAMHHRKTG